MSELLAHVPYCGVPPTPADLWFRWNFDLTLIAALAALLIAHGVQLRVFSIAKTHERQPRRSLFYGGWAALAFGFISPLCALGVALFSARVTQHAWLTMIAAPLLVLAGARTVPVHPMARPMTATGLFAVMLWLWHSPVLYDLTFRSDLAYWLMHISLTGAALLLWRGLLRGDDEAWVARMGAGFLTVAHMGLLGALITLAPRTLYQAHLVTTEPWGLSPLEDQQLGGLIMWVPTGAVLLGAALSILYGVLKKPGVTSPRLRTE